MKPPALLDARTGALLAGLLVHHMFATPLTELLELNTLTRVGLVLRCHVVTTLAFLASQSNRRSLGGGHCHFLSVVARARRFRDSVTLSLLPECV